MDMSMKGQPLHKLKNHSRTERMTQNSACIVEVAANDAEMEYGPKLNGGFLTPANARDEDCFMQYGFCICCGPICFPLSLVVTLLVTH